MLEIPNFITHYNRGEPFRSITSFSRNEWQSIVSNLNEMNTWGLNRFSDSEYLERRLVVEKRVRQEFIDKGGKPELEHPIYCFLGRNADFEKHKSNKAYTILLENISPDTISFSYGDTMIAYNEDYVTQFGEKYQNSLCRNIFLRNDLKNIFSNNAYPKSNPLCIEAQLWSLPDLKHIVR